MPSLWRDKPQINQREIFRSFCFASIRASYSGAFAVRIGVNSRFLFSFLAGAVRAILRDPRQRISEPVYR
jgi:hypothetical protein